MALWDSKAQTAVMEALEAAKTADREHYKDVYDRVLEYADGDMLQDTEERLKLRYRAAQSGDMRSNIEAVTLALVSHYVNEMATLYAQPVERTVVDDAGEVNEDLTKIYTDALEDIGFDQTMGAVERVVVLLRSCGLLFQVTDGVIDPVVFPPQDIYPVPKDLEGVANLANPSVYQGFDLDLRAEVMARGVRVRRFAYVQPEGVAIYTGQKPGDIRETLGTYPNPYRVEGAPAQMLTIWHGDKPTGELLPMFEPTVYTSNRWLNVLWSFMLDVLRFQGGALMVKTVTNPDAIREYEPVGVRNPAVLGPEESAKFTSAGNNFQGAIELLQGFAKLLGLSLSMSPTDFSIEPAKVESGIARRIANLPKIRERAKRARWFAKQEERIAYPLIVAMMEELGMEGAADLRSHYLTVSYAGDDVIMSTEEKIAAEAHDIAIGVATPASVLAGREGISVDEAASILEAWGVTPAEDEEIPAPEPTPESEPAPEEPARGAMAAGQITALWTVLQEVANGKADREATKAFIAATYPTIEDPSALVDSVPEPEGEQVSTAPEDNAPDGDDSEPGPVASPPASATPARGVLARIAAQRAAPDEDEDA